MAGAPNVPLPEPVIHKIFSFLSPKDAIRASASSKLWRSAWISFPIFSFDESALPFKKSDFFDHVDRSLALWYHRCDDRLNMEKLSLSVAISDCQSFSRLIDVVAVATSRNVKAIELKNCADYLRKMTESDNLWNILSTCDSLTDCSLQLFRIYLLNSLPKTSSLRKLSLISIMVDNYSFRNLLAGFPLLQELNIDCCFGLTELHISSPNLVKLTISSYNDPAPKVIIDAANLQSFDYIRFFSSAGSISFSTNMKLLTSLRIERCNFVSASTIDELITQILLLQDLSLESCKFPDGTRISHSNLKSLRLRWCWDFAKLEIDTPNLCFFSYSGHIVLFSTFRYSPGILNTELTFVCHESEWFWFIELRNFLECLGDCHTVKLHGYLAGFSEQLKDDNLLPDPFYEMRHLDITILTLPISDFFSVVYTMVELFPCIQTLSLKTAVADIFIELDENGSVRLNWRKFLHLDDDTSQSVDATAYEILEWLCPVGGMEDDTPSCTEALFRPTRVLR